MSTDGLAATASTAGASCWFVGDAVISQVDETVLFDQGSWLLPEATPELTAGARSWLPTGSLDAAGGLVVAVHSFVVELGGLRIVIDTGVGNAKVRDNPVWNDLDTDYLQRLVAAGAGPETVDLVITTHLHRDHVGWNTRLENGRWVPTFPNARYLVSSTEHAHLSQALLSEDQHRMVADSLDPVVQAGLVHLVDLGDGQDAVTGVADGIELVSTPGHTPGHVSVRVTSRGRSALITGDALHHPVQIAHPRVGCGVDVDPAAATRSRRALLVAAADRGELLLGTHFTAPSAGRVLHDGDTFRFTPVPPDGPDRPHR